MVNPLPKSHSEFLPRLIQDDNLVLFVGAGISRQALPTDGSKRRLPLWSDLAEDVARRVGDDLKNYNGNVLDFFDSIEANIGRGELEEAVRASIQHELFLPSNTHTEIAKIPWNCIVTTNYDNLLSKVLSEPSPVSEEADYDWLSRQPESRPKLIHIHGTLSRPHTLTGRDYISWDEKHPRAYSFLENVALNKTILFVGYSFSDPHLKHGLLPWILKAMAGRGKRHFAWMWDVTPEQKKLLDKRDMIDVFSINKDADWSLSFEQICASIQQTSRATKKQKKNNDDKKIDKGEQDTAIVNGYKLFFYRNQSGISSRLLGRETGIDPQIINNIEQVKTTTGAGPNCFKRLDRSSLSRIEHALGCIGRLEFGRSDDFLAKYIMFYKVNKHSKQKQYNATQKLDFLADTKAVVFDFGGTLSRSSSQLSTWERMWLSVGYSTADAGHYHRRFVAKQIDHQQWCDATATKLRERGFSKAHLQKIIDDIEPIEGLAETLSTLHEQGTAIYIVSGSIKQIIVEIVGQKLFSMFNEVKSNEILFDDNGVIKSIKGHDYDFEGKSDFLKHVIAEQKCSPLDVLFVGNSLNDSWASRSGVRTLCVNPADVDFSNTFVWSDYIREMKDLREILPHAARRPPPSN